MTPPSRILVVRLGALGDIVHTLPVVPALRAALPKVEIHWLVEARHAALAALVEGVDRWIVWEAPRLSGPGGARDVVATLRAQRYDAALDLQGLLKSAVLARCSGAARIIGFPTDHLREKAALLFYSEQPGIGDVSHVIDRQLGLLRALGIPGAPRTFPLRVASTPAADAALRLAEGGPFALLIPGAGFVLAGGTPAPGVMRLGSPNMTELAGRWALGPHGRCHARRLRPGTHARGQ